MLRLHFGSPKFVSPKFGSPKFCQILSLLYIGLCRLRFEEKPPILESQTLVKFYLFFTFAYLKTLHVSSFKKLKTLNFVRHYLGGFPIFESPLFVKFILFFDIHSFQKFDTFASNGLKVQNFDDPVSGEPLFWQPQIWSNFIFP